MVNKKDDNKFMPTIAIPPGETIKENMEFLGMNQKELAKRLDISEKHLSNIVNGNSPITYDTALKLETVIGPSAKFWMNLETNYQLSKSRLEEEQDLDKDLEILKGIPYKKMSDLGWVDETSSRTERIFNCRRFFGVTKLGSIESSYAVAFRKHEQVKDISDLGILAWLRKAELEGMSVEIDNMDRKKLKALIPIFRELTMKQPKEFYPEMKRLCAEAGIALVLVESLPKTYICGATIWRNNKAILALSVRGKKADIFWFTFFHELAHLINHSTQEFHINYNGNGEEYEADIIASNYLIPDEKYQEFINSYNYKDKNQIIDYSEEIGIAPCILVGRLLHDGLIRYQYYDDLRPSFEIVRRSA